MSKAQRHRVVGRLSGVAAVEFAIIIIPLTLLVFGSAEVGRLLYQQNSLTQALHVGARYVGRQFDRVNAADCSLIVKPGRPTWTEVKEQAANLIVCGELSCVGRDPVVPGLQPGDITISDPVLDAGLGRCVIALEATVPFQPLFGDSLVPIFEIPVPSLNSRIEERYIGY